MIRVGIFITGNEILYGKTRDTNGAFVANHFRKYGIAISNTLVCADNEDDLLRGLSFLSQSCDVILMTGGLGPTSDDLTAQIVARFLKVPLEFHDHAWQNCLNIYKKLGRTSVPESNRKQAYLPKGCVLLPNPMGTATGFAVSGVCENRKVTVYCMPGVPLEMEPMFLNFVLPHLSDPKRLPVHKTWQVFSLGESAMQSAIETAEKNLLACFPEAVISYQAHAVYVTYSVTLFYDSTEKKEDCEKYLNEHFTQSVEQAFGHHILYSGEKVVESYVEEKLKEEKWSFFFVKLLDYLFEFHSKTEEILKDFSKYVSQNTALKMNSDIALASCILPRVSESVPKTGFLFLTIRKQLVQQLPDIEKRLSVFSWKLSVVENGYATWICSLNLNPNHTRQVQQNRMELFGLCSLAAVLVPHTSD